MYSKADLDIDNIETLYGALEFGLMIDKFGGKRGYEIRYLRDSLIKLIVTTIEHSIKFSFDITNKKIFPPTVYKNFFPQLGQLMAKCNFSFITFNYDLIIDIALESISANYSYALDSKDKSDTYLLKLHGALNWYPTQYSIQVEPISKFTNELTFSSPDDFLPIGTNIINSGRLPLIIPPTLNKFKHQEQLSSIWQKAAEVLSDAELIFIIGYSMPETDVFFKYLYSLGIDSPVYLNKVVVINPNGNLNSAYQSLMSNLKEPKKFQFITGSFTQYSDSIFNEIKKLVS